MTNIEIISVVLSYQLDETIDPVKWIHAVENMQCVERISKLSDLLFHVHTIPKNILELVEISDSIIDVTRSCKKIGGDKFHECLLTNPVL